MYPELNELSTRSPDGFQPHLTLGQYSTRGRDNLLENVKKGWKNIEFEVSRGWGMIGGCAFLIDYVFMLEKTPGPTLKSFS